jgi:sporulation protein YlmC with PRC-barrel domain
MMATRSESELRKDETNKLIGSDKVEGTPVVNNQGEKLGTIDKVMIDKISGKVAYAVMSFGGFLGVGDRHHALPWSVLTYDTSKDGYVVNIDKDTLEQGPTFAANETPNYEDETWGRQVHDYYKVRPYWT